MNTKPIIRQHIKLEASIRLAEALMPAFSDEILQSCINCLYFNEQSERCGKFGLKPPARVIALGCSQYSDVDTPPFGDEL